MPTVNVYTLADKDIQLTANFKVGEFACTDGSYFIFISPELLTLLQRVRDHYGRPLKINSGYRTHTRNRAVGGVKNSTHCQGLAADIAVKGVNTKELAAFLDSIIPDTGGIGTYASFVHVDVRQKKARWKGGNDG